MRDSYVIARSKLLLLVWGLGFNKVERAPKVCGSITIPSSPQYEVSVVRYYAVRYRESRKEHPVLRESVLDTGWIGKLVESCSLEAHGFLSLLTNILDPASNGGSIFVGWPAFLVTWRQLGLPGNYDLVVTTRWRLSRTPARGLGFVLVTP